MKKILNGIKSQIDALSRPELILLVTSNMWYIDEGHIRRAKYDDLDRRAQAQFDLYQELTDEAYTFAQTATEHLDSGNIGGFEQLQTEVHQNHRKAARHFAIYLKYSKQCIALLQPVKEQDHAA